LSRVIEYTPSPTLERFHGSNAFVRGVRGPIGSGKSVAMCWEIYTRAYEQAPGPDGVRRSRWVIIRNTYGELESTTVQTWLDWFPQELVGKLVYGAPITQLCKFKHDDGSAIELDVWFLALDRPDHVKKLLSLECTGIWINEARELPKAILDAATGRVGRYPSKRDGGPTWFGVIMDTNPPDTDHWWYRLAEEQQPEDFEFFAQPPGDSEQAENTANLPDGYYARLKGGKTDEWIKVYVRGDYGFVLDGKPVYPEFRDSLHVREFSIIKGLPLYGGMDFGLTPAGVFGQRLANGQIRIHSELVTEDMGVKRFGALWLQEANLRYPGLEFAAITGDPAGNARGDDERTSFDILKGENVDAKPAYTNDFTMRREAFAAPMGRLIDGEPGLLIHPQCKRLRKALAGGYHYKRVKVAGADRFHDQPDKNMHSHVAEAGQYLVLGMGAGRELKRTERYRPQRAAGQRTAITRYNVLD
jgi:hypothetical protein